MKIAILGSSGQLGNALRRHFTAAGGHSLVLVSRNPLQSRQEPGVQEVRWDGVNRGTWETALEDADVVINLAGRSVNCRYSKKNIAEMLHSRVASTRATGIAIGSLSNPPRVWLQMSTATLYAHTYGKPNDEDQGIPGGAETDVPRSWDFSVAIANSWEAEMWRAPTPATRKVLLRTAMVMTPDEGGVFATFCNLARFGLGGAHAHGRQYVSWIHETDFLGAVEHLIATPEARGVYNLCAPEPLPNWEFMAELRKALGVALALPTPEWLLRLGAALMGTETELLMKSRRVVPTKLQNLGFAFRYPTWSPAVVDLVARRQASTRSS